MPSERGKATRFWSFPFFGSTDGRSYFPHPHHQDAAGASPRGELVGASSGRRGAAAADDALGALSSWARAGGIGSLACPHAGELPVSLNWGLPIIYSV